MQAQTRPLKLYFRHRSYLTPLNSCWLLLHGIEDTESRAVGW